MNFIPDKMGFDVKAIRLSTKMASSTQSDPQTRTTTWISSPPNLPSTLITTTHLLSPTFLNASPHLPALFTLINLCFNTSHNLPGHSYLPFSPTSRLRTEGQLAEEIGPNGFTLVMLAEDASTETNTGEEVNVEGQVRERGRVIATASAKPYTTPPQEITTSGRTSASLFKRQPGTDKELDKYKDLPKWEILLMVVDPTLQGHGIATQLMSMTIEEIKWRVVSAASHTDTEGTESGASKGRIMLLLSSMQELNESYYAKRGWTTTSVRRFPPGTMESRDGFGVVEMMKIVDL